MLARRRRAAVALFGPLLLFATTDAGATPRSSCSWAVTATPTPVGSGAQLRDVVTFSSTDAWAVGWTDEGGLIQHWNGNRWKAVGMPTLRGAALMGIAGSALDDIWAVGEAGDGSSLTLHFDGSTWVRVRSPSRGSQTDLEHVSAIAVDDVWAVGESYSVRLGAWRNFTAHWDGTAWRLMPIASIGTNYNLLRGVVAIDPSDVRAVGD